MKTFKKVLLALLSAPWGALVFIISIILAVGYVMVLLTAAYVEWCHGEFEDMGWDIFWDDIKTTMNELYFCPIWRIEI